MAWRICGTASHQRWHIGKSGVRLGGRRGPAGVGRPRRARLIQQDLRELANPALPGLMWF